jgi:hypothetical protein
MRSMMMKTLRVGLAMGMALAVSGVAEAACRSGDVFKRVGTVQTADAVITSRGQDIHAVALDCGGTACLAGFNDTNSDSNWAVPVAAANVTLEVGAAANESKFFDLSETPIYFKNGIYFVDNGNIDYVVLFSCEPR